VQELGQLLDPLDERWKAFGFKKPGAQVTGSVGYCTTVNPALADPSSGQSPPSVPGRAHQSLSSS
jgi:hypothetical protein